MLRPSTFFHAAVPGPIDRARSTRGRDGSRSFRSTRPRAAAAVAAGAALTLALSACAGSAGGGGGTGSGGSGEGYEYGASEEEIRAAFADIDPITITYQPSAQSAQGIDAYRALAFIENIETLSDGKVTVEAVYGQAIAGYTELGDALADGRVDVAYMLPVYQPDEYPVFQGYVTGSTLTGTSPLVDELAANAALGELTWNDPNYLAEFEEKGLHPLNSFNAAGAVMALCKDPHTSAEDWNGNQVRVSGTAQSAQLEAVHGSPVSLQYTETFEALERGTIDCTFSTTLAAIAGGFLDVAPNVGYTTDVTFARGPGAVMAGSAWESWPLAVQQLVFDAMADEFTESRRGDLDGNYFGLESVRSAGGEFRELDADVQSSLLEKSEGLVEAEIEKGTLPEGSAEAIAESMEKWRGIAAELGYEDAGTFSDYDEWYPQEDTEYLAPYGQRYFEEVMLPHRPS
ncbi:TRAP transporter substrate-binding protein DctP [Brevibacterium samyangense]|uniref:TRAP-type C4-dicarboxylate transport system, substrate-binding protein n=1 Tax=Brevibacterium samyangense TaxID=366888 RepID=A0ABP5ENI0_9MICO